MSFMGQNYDSSFLNVRIFCFFFIIVTWFIKSLVWGCRSNKINYSMVAPLALGNCTGQLLFSLVTRDVTWLSWKTESWLNSYSDKVKSRPGLVSNNLFWPGCSSSDRRLDLDLPETALSPESPEETTMSGWVQPLWWREQILRQVKMDDENEKCRRKEGLGEVENIQETVLKRLQKMCRQKVDFTWKCCCHTAKATQLRVSEDALAPQH